MDPLNEFFDFDLPSNFRQMTFKQRRKFFRQLSDDYYAIEDSLREHRIFEIQTVVDEMTLISVTREFPSFTLFLEQFSVVFQGNHEDGDDVILNEVYRNFKNVHVATPSVPSAKLLFPSQTISHKIVDLIPAIKSTQVLSTDAVISPHDDTLSMLKLIKSDVQLIFDVVSSKGQENDSHFNNNNIVACPADTVTPAEIPSLVAGPTVTQIEDITQSQTQNTYFAVTDTNSGAQCEITSPCISSVACIRTSLVRDLCLYLKRVVVSFLIAHNISNVHNCMRILKFAVLVMSLKSQKPVHVFIYDPGGF
jgi:hypothetical protein